MADWNFNLSYSAYSLFKESELVFFFSHILKSETDTQVVQSYGLAGNVVHEIAEKLTLDTLYDFEKDFEEKWKEKKLDFLPGMNGKPLEKKKYLKYLNKLRFYLTNTLEVSGDRQVEVKLQIQTEEYQNLVIKGYVDLVISTEDGIYLFDYKTNSTSDYEMHKLQRLFYSFLYWKQYGIIPRKCSWLYLSRDGNEIEETDSFTVEDLLVFDSEIKKFIEDILKKGKDISQYSVGSIDSPFNAHYHKCREEQKKRENKSIIYAIIEKNQLILENVPDKLLKAIRQKYSYKVDGAEWSAAYKKHVWDGMKHLTKIVQKNGVQKIIMPFAFQNNFEKLISDYNSYFGLSLIISYTDKRNSDITSKVFKTGMKKSKHELRSYQLEAVNKMLEKRVGIINTATGSGKTVIASELIRILNRRTLFLVNRIELCRQTKEVFEEELGIEIGEMSEGNIDVSHQITVASIQTIAAIMKRGDESSKQLALYLHNVTCTIYDECQNVTEPGIYGFIASMLTNSVYFIALSGSPWRTGNSTLELNALCGFVEYSKTSEQLEKEGYLCPTRCLFFRYGNPLSSYGETEELYNDVYTKHVVENQERNNAISNLVQKYRKTRKILVITKRVQHAELLGKMIENSIVITGSSESEYRKTMFEKFKNTNDIVLIGSIQIFSTGINIPDLDVIVNCSAHKSSVSSIQICGRVKRIFPGKEYGLFIDFVDHHPYLKSAMKERKKILQQFGNEVLEVDYRIPTEVVQTSSG